MRFSRSAIHRAIFGNSDPEYASVNWLLPLDGANGATVTVDRSSYQVATTMSACSLTTSGSKWGGSCALMTSAPTSCISARVIGAGTSQFIVEGWFYIDNTVGTQVLWSANNYATATGYEVYLVATTLNLYAANGNFTLSAPAALTAGVFLHIALTRNSSNLVSLWVNGVSVASGTWAGDLGHGYVVGNIPGGSPYSFVGKVDDFRVTHGTSRGASVTVPTSAFPTSGASAIYARLNPADAASGYYVTSDGLSLTTTSSAGMSRSTLGKSSGLWSWPATCGGGSLATVGVALATDSLALAPGTSGSGVAYYANGAIFNAGVNTATVASFTTGDVITTALDLVGNTVKFYKNGALVRTEAISAGTWYALAGTYGSTAAAWTLNFGQSAIAFTPAGYNTGLYY